MCDHCNTPTARFELHKRLDDDNGVFYCPYCGEALLISSFINDLKANIDEYIEEHLLNGRQEVLDENGNPMIMERQKSSKPEKPSIGTPLSMAIDLNDGDDISKELKLLEKHQKKRESRAEILANHYIEFMKEKGYFDDNT
jgi:hypothetical protein